MSSKEINIEISQAINKVNQLPILEVLSQFEIGEYNSQTKLGISGDEGRYSIYLKGVTGSREISVSDFLEIIIQTSYPISNYNKEAGIYCLRKYAVDLLPLGSPLVKLRFSSNPLVATKAEEAAMSLEYIQSTVPYLVSLDRFTRHCLQSQTWEYRQFKEQFVFSFIDLVIASNRFDSGTAIDSDREPSKEFADLFGKLVTGYWRTQTDPSC